MGLRASGYADHSAELFRLVAEHSAIGMSLVSAGGEFRWVNPAMCDLMGRTADTLLRMSWQDIAHPDDRATTLQDLQGLQRGDFDTRRGLRRYLRSDGSVLWGDLSVSCLRSASGEVELFVSQVLDVTTHVTARHELAESQARYRLLAENASDVVSRADSDGVVQWISPSVREIFGWTPEQMVGTRSVDLIHPDDRLAVAERLAGLPEGRAITNRMRLLCADGKYRWVGATARPLFDDAGVFIGRVVGWRDITAEVAALEALAASEEHYRLLAENATDVIMKVVDGVLAWVSPSAETVLGLPAFELLGMRLRDLLHPEDADEPCLTLGDRGRCELRVATSAGGWLWMSDAWHRIPDDGEQSGEIHSLRDINSEREARDALQFLAYHDALTRLATRPVAETRLEQLLGGERRGDDRIAVLFIDIDNLKGINDRFGHAAGDQAIHTIAQRLAANARAEDVVARFGGDEFVIILTSVGALEDVRAAADRIRCDAQAPIPVNDSDAYVSVSVGIAFAGPGGDPHDVLRRADAALYRAKRSGRDQVMVDDLPV